MKLQFTRRLAIALVSAFVIAGAAAFVAVSRTPREGTSGQTLPVGGHFRLMAADGRVVTDRSFNGKWLLIYFGYTSCPDACPTALSDMTIALEQLGPLADKIQPLFITVDPERDTSQVIADYVGSFDPRFIGARGTAEETAAVAEEYRVYYAVRPLGNNEYAIDHSSFIYVVNPQGGTVKLLTGDLPGHKMADELRQLIR